MFCSASLKTRASRMRDNCRSGWHHRAGAHKVLSELMEERSCARPGSPPARCCGLIHERVVAAVAVRALTEGARRRSLCFRAAHTHASPVSRGDNPGERPSGADGGREAEVYVVGS